jgi:3-hydroxyacyl-CoA dehydrogenase/3a,7a,12a-trihydroxy-5b-cholest-24-enoyl-CoA hydratase
MSELRFDDKVVVVTGAGNGLGKVYAHFFAKRGAKVVVNDLGGSVHGEGGSSSVADKVVQEIKALGGEAVANYNSVTEGDKIIKTAIDAYGRIDVLVNNAGILRDISLAKMTNEDWNKVFEVHVQGMFSCTKAAWGVFREQSCGKIINTSSGAGIYGAFGQSNYSAAKLAVHGFTQALAKEGESRNIQVNTIAPIAGTRMTETVLAQELIKALDPAYVVPLVAYLAHEDTEETGSLFEAGAGYFAKLRWQRTVGVSYDYDQITPENIARDWEKLTDWTDATNPETLNDTLCEMMNNVERNQTNLSEDNAKAADIFQMMIDYLEAGEGADLPKKVGAIFEFNIKEKKGGPVTGTWTVDVKNSPPRVMVGKGAGKSKADASFTMMEDDFKLICLGKLNPQMGFMQGKIKIKGNIGKATLFTPDLFPEPTAENVMKYTKAKL